MTIKATPDAVAPETPEADAPALPASGGAYVRHANGRLVADEPKPVKER